MQILYLITARGGSKGIPGKNIRSLGGKPLLHYAIDLARCFTTDENICLSTDSKEIISSAADKNLKVPFVRPENLASDTAGSYEVIMHAISYYESQGKKYDAVVLLQPTSPFRLKSHLQKALSEYNSDIDMVVSVKESHADPHNLFKENENGHLEKYLPGTSYTRRQDVPRSYEYNGAIYIMNVNRLREKSLSEFTSIKKMVMDELSSVDLDTSIDWLWAEFLINNNYIKLDHN